MKSLRQEVHQRMFRQKHQKAFQPRNVIVQIPVNAKAAGVMVPNRSTMMGIANIFVRLEDSVEIVDFIWRVLAKIADIASTVKSFILN